MPHPKHTVRDSKKKKKKLTQLERIGVAIPKI